MNIKAELQTCLLIIPQLTYKVDTFIFLNSFEYFIIKNKKWIILTIQKNIKNLAAQKRGRKKKEKLLFYRWTLKWCSIF